MPVRSLSVEVLSGPDAGARHVASSDRITIGTAPGNDLVLTDDTVSRYHLELERVDRGILVTDPGSTNGVLAGSTLIHKATVKPGTVLSLGKTTIRADEGGTVTLELYDDDQLGKLRGRSPEMRRLMASIQRAAQSDASVLILGETGTGKELIARAIHEASPRASKPLETVDCGAQLPTLIASELFGHEKGAFTGADRQHTGAFERADGGTIFLDEMGELPNSLQPMLLGALERRSFRRVGGTKAIGVDVRFICATHRDLRGEVNTGAFRQDLYYRIAVITLRVPALRDRPGDIPILVEHFLREAGFDGEVDEIITPTAMAALKAYSWPGNVRELRNFVESALAMGEAPHLGDRESHAQAKARAASIAGGDGMGLPLAALFDLPYSDARSSLLADFESRYLTQLLERTRGNVSEASRQAKINRGYLNALLKKHGLRDAD